MALILIGLFLWWEAHLFKSAAPGLRAVLTAQLGPASKAIFALQILAGVVLMVIGYKQAEFVPVYDLGAWTIHLNNLLMLLAVILFGMGSSKGRMRSWFRHPMLMGFMLWAIAHLLVNGDLASIVLFGGLLAWAPVAMVMINARDGAWVRPEPGPVKGDIRLLVISAVVFAVLIGLHSWLGPWPLPGGAA